MTSYNLNIMGLSETQWKENSEIKTQNGNFMILSGVGGDIDHRSGVGILIDKEAQRSLMKWSPSSERIILACFKTNLQFNNSQMLCPNTNNGQGYERKIIPATA